MPSIFDGDASDSAAVLQWILELNGVRPKSAEKLNEDNVEDSTDDDREPSYYLLRRREGESDQTFVVGNAPSVVLVTAGGVSVYKSEKLIKPFS